MNYIGIDPDCEKSGLALVENGEITQLHNLKFWELIEFLSEHKDHTVVIEAGWLNKSTSHHAANSIVVAANIGSRVGANLQTGKLIDEFCIHYGIKKILSKPTKSKVNHETFVKITRWPKRTNQEQRDAGLLVLGRK